MIKRINYLAGGVRVAVRIMLAVTASPGDWSISDASRYSMCAAVIPGSSMKAFITGALIIMDVAAEALSDEVQASSIVSEGYVIKGFAAINYVF